MAEAVGIVTGVAGLVGTFTSCLECFKIIQLGRNFERDFKDHQLTLDLLHGRLWRWGQGMGLDADSDDPLPLSPLTTSKGPGPELAERVVRQILDLFEESSAKAVKYRQEPWNADNLAVCSPANLGPVEKSIHEKFLSLSIRGKKGPSKRDIAKWALYEAEDFQFLVTKIDRHLNNLEKVFPISAEREESLLRDEAARFSDKMEIDTIGGVAEKFDGKLHQKLSESGHKFRDVRTNNESRIHNGDMYAADWSGNIVGASHSFEGIYTDNKSRVQNGNQYGGKSVFDD